MADAAALIGEILDYFDRTGKDPGGWWAPPEDGSGLGLYYPGEDGSSFTLDLERDGTIRLFWWEKGKPYRGMTFVAKE